MCVYTIYCNIIHTGQNNQILNQTCFPKRLKIITKTKISQSKMLKTNG